MGLDFVALDFETANLFRGSPCAVGWAIVREGSVIDGGSQLIYQDSFDPFNIAIHGITEDDVADAPTFGEVWPTIYKMIGDLPMVAHNAAFDTGVIRDALDDADEPWPLLTYACTLVMGRRTYELPSYRLPFVAQAAGLGYDEDSHHKADYDAELAAQILLDIARRYEVGDIQALAEVMKINLGKINGDDWHGCRAGTHSPRAGYGMASGDFTINVDADSSNPLYGAGFTFTGKLGSMTRRLAMRRVAECGGKPLDSTTVETNYLVFGYQDARYLRPGDSRSSKFTKALTLKEKGQDIEILGEDDFIALLQEAGVDLKSAPATKEARENVRS